MEGVSGIASWPSTERQNVLLAEYIVVGHALLLLMLALAYYSWALLADYQMPILCAILVSTGLRGICDRSIKFWKRQLEERSLVSCLALFVWLQYARFVNVCISPLKFLPASYLLVDLLQVKLAPECYPTSSSASTPYFHTLFLLIVLHKFWPMVVSTIIGSTVFTIIWRVSHWYLFPSKPSSGTAQKLSSPPPEPEGEALPTAASEEPALLAPGEDTALLTPSELASPAAAPDDTGLRKRKAGLRSLTNTPTKPPTHVAPRPKLGSSPGAASKSPGLPSPREQAGSNTSSISAKSAKPTGFGSSVPKESALKPRPKSNGVSATAAREKLDTSVVSDSGALNSSLLTDSVDASFLSESPGPADPGTDAAPDPAAEPPTDPVPSATEEDAVPSSALEPPPAKAQGLGPLAPIVLPVAVVVKVLDRSTRKLLIDWLRPLTTIGMILGFFAASSLLSVYFTFQILQEARGVLVELESTVDTALVHSEAALGSGQGLAAHALHQGQASVRQLLDAHLPDILAWGGPWVEEHMRSRNLTGLADTLKDMLPELEGYLQGALSPEAALNSTGAKGAGAGGAEAAAEGGRIAGVVAAAEALYGRLRAASEKFLTLQFGDARQELLLAWAELGDPELDPFAAMGGDGVASGLLQSLPSALTPLLATARGTLKLSSAVSSTAGTLLRWAAAYGMRLVSLLLMTMETLMNFLMFLFLTYYILAAEGDLVNTFVTALPIRPTKVDAVVRTISNAVQGVGQSALKLASFHVGLTYLAFSFFGTTRLLYCSMLASAGTAILPFPPVYAITVPAALELAASGQLWSAGVLVVGYYFVSSYAFWAIYEDIPGSPHPYITGLSVVGGMSLFKTWHGALFGPLLLTAVSVMFNLYKQLIKRNVDDPVPLTPTVSRSSLEF